MKLNKILVKIGISADKLAFTYIIKMVNIIKRKKSKIKLTDLYKLIANKTDKNITPASVERAIRYSKIKAYEKSSILNEIYSHCPDNSEFIYDLVYNLDLYIDEINKLEKEN